MKIKNIFLLVVLIFLSLSFVFKPKIARGDELIKFYMKDEIKGIKKQVEVGKGKIGKFTYNISKKDETFKIIIKGDGPLSFIIVFNGFSKIFPDDGILNSPFLILKGKDRFLMFSVSLYDKNFWELKTGEGKVYVIYNLYIRKRREVEFRIDDVSGIRDGVKRYRDIYSFDRARINTGGTLYPDASLTNLRNAGIYDFNLSFRIIDPLNENFITRISECKNFNIKPFLIFNPFKYSLITKRELSPEELYFSNDYIKKIFSIAILTSGIKDAKGDPIKIIKKAEPVLTIKREVKGKSVLVKEIPDMREGLFEETFLLYPDKDFLRNMGISAYETNFFYNIFYANIDINAENRKRSLSKDEKLDYVGYTVDLTGTKDIFDYNTSHSKGENLTFKDKKPSIYFPFEILSFIEKEKKNLLIMTINPSIFQIGFNSDIVLKEIHNLSYLKSLPLNRAIYNKRILIFSLSLPTEEINKELVEKFFNRCLLFGVYPTFTKDKSDPYSLWNKQDLVNLVKPYFSRYIPLIREINKKEWEPKTFARVSDGDVERFGNYPDMLFTIDGTGYLEIDKKSLNIDDDYKVLDFESKKPLRTSEENGKIYVKLENTKVVRVFKGEKNLPLISKFTKKEYKSPIFLFLLPPLFFIPLFIKNFLLKSPPLKIVLPLIVTLSFLVRRFLFIPSPPFIFLLLSLIHFLSSFYFTNMKRRVFSLVSIYFFFMFLFFVLVNEGFKVNPFPPFYFPMNFYLFTIFLSSFLLITTMYETKRRTNLFIIVLFFLTFVFSPITSFSFLSPPLNIIFLITAISIGLILLFISRRAINFILTILYFILLVVYLFWDRIYFYLLNHSFFLGRDFLPSIIIATFTLLSIIFTMDRDFIKPPDGLYTIFLIVISVMAISFHTIFIHDPSRVNIFLVIIKIVVYAFLILFSIYVFEVLVSRREE